MDRLWVLDEAPSTNTLHKMSYSGIRSNGFRAHHVKQIYVYARAVVKATKRNGGKKPALRKLTARIDGYDHRLDLRNRLLILKVHGSMEVKLKLPTSSEQIEKFKDWDNYELAVKVVEDGIYVAVYLRRSVKPRKPRPLRPSI